MKLAIAILLLAGLIFLWLQVPVCEGGTIVEDAPIILPVKVGEIMTFQVFPQSHCEVAE